MFSLPLASALFGAEQAQSALHACCRRDGRHHCSMPADGSSNVGTVGEKCPFAPAAPAMLLHLSFTLGMAAAIFAGIIRHPALSPQTEAQLRVSFDRARQKRGPPALVA
jgi:hypothetical protein